MPTARWRACSRGSRIIALLDIGLPGCDGYELARRFRGSAAGRRVFLVAVTGYGQPEDRGRAIEAGFNAHLVKPVGPDALAEVIALARGNRQNR